MSSPRLSIELVPRSCFYSNLRSNLSKQDWDFLRNECYAHAGYVCEICGGRGSRHAVECHEIWEYDDLNHIQTLVGLIALCPKCHKAKHMALAREMGWHHEAERHLCAINKWDEKTLQAYLDEVFELFEQRSQHAWQLDITWLEGKGVCIPDHFDR
jgi:hypothetical protein